MKKKFTILSVLFDELPHHIFLEKLYVDFEGVFRRKSIFTEKCMVKYSMILIVVKSSDILIFCILIRFTEKIPYPNI